MVEYYQSEKKEGACHEMAFTSAHGAAPSFSGSPALLARWIILAGTNARFEQVQSGGVFRRCKILSGNRSPNEIERREKGYSAAWLHHKGRNKHHLEYWIDYAADGSGMCGMKMPIQYVIEMFCDRVAASKTYRGAAYRDSDPYDYYAHSVDHYIIHPDTAAALESLLRILRDEGEERAFAAARKLLKTGY